MVKFELFSDEWFAMLSRTNKRNTSLNLSTQMQSINLNIQVILDDNFDKNIRKYSQSKIQNKLADTEETQDTIAMQDNIINLHLCDGYFFNMGSSQKHVAEAESVQTTLLLSLNTLLGLAKNQKMSCVLDAFINGYIQVQGDMSQLMAIQKVHFSEEQIKLYKSLLDQTNLPTTIHE